MTGKTSLDVTTVRARLASAQCFSGQAIRIASIYHRASGEKCFRVDTGAGSRVYKVRFADERNPIGVATEHEAFSTLLQHGVAWTPRVYEYNVDVPEYLVIEYEEGESLDKSLRWASHANLIVSSLRKLLGDMHGITGDYFGHLGGPRYPSWRGFFEERLWQHVLPIARAGLIDEGDLRRVKSLYEEAREALDGIRPTLLHGDVKPANIVFDADSLKTKLIDFELARFGDVEFEWEKVRRLAVELPEYSTFIAQPLLDTVACAEPPGAPRRAKLLLYAFSQACSFVTFECQHGLPIPAYLITELQNLRRALERHT